MGGPWKDQATDNSGADGTAPFRLELAPHETLIWSGRPHSVKRLVLQTTPKAITGLGLIALTLIWVVMVVRGGNNNWDKGQAVAPFAEHNIAIAAIAGLWMISPSLFLLFWPLRTWRRLERTCYALTDRRAVVIAPGFAGRHKTKSFTGDELRLMRVEDQGDGTGDLIFASPSTWVGMAETIGFLGIEQVRDVEALVRQKLLSKVEGKIDPAAMTATKNEPSAPIRKCYRLSLSIRLFQFVFLVAGGLGAACVIADIILVSAVLVIGPDRFFGAPGLRLEPFPGENIVASIAVGVGSLLVAVMVLRMFFHFALRIPIEITIDENREVHFRGRMKSVTIPVADIAMIRTGQWFDPNRFQAVVHCKRGKLTLINDFSDFTDFLATVKSFNPAIEIRGF